MNTFNNMSQQSKAPTKTQSNFASFVNISKRNEFRNELKQIYKIGDLYSDTNLIREKCRIMKCETIKDLTKASYKSPDINNMGVLVLINFRLIFQFENENNLHLIFLKITLKFHYSVFQK